MIDPANGVDEMRDVAVTGNRIVRVAADIPASEARRVVNVQGYYVTPGLVDLHTHVYLESAGIDRGGGRRIAPRDHHDRRRGSARAGRSSTTSRPR